MNKNIFLTIAGIGVVGAIVLYFKGKKSTDALPANTDTSPPGPYQPPAAPTVANFKISGSGSLSPASIAFTNLSQNASLYSWNFGDGSTESTANSPTHTYENAGDFTVTLVAKGNGDEKSITKTVTVLPNAPDWDVLNNYDSRRGFYEYILFVTPDFHYKIIEIQNKAKTEKKKASDLWAAYLDTYFAPGVYLKPIFSDPEKAEVYKSLLNEHIKTMWSNPTSKKKIQTTANSNLISWISQAIKDAVKIENSPLRSSNGLAGLSGFDDSYYSLSDDMWSNKRHYMIR